MFISIYKSPIGLLLAWLALHTCGNSCSSACLFACVSGLGWTKNELVCVFCIYTDSRKGAHCEFVAPRQREMLKPGFWAEKSTLLCSKAHWPCSLLQYLFCHLIHLVVHSETTQREQVSAKKRGKTLKHAAHIHWLVVVLEALFTSS